MGYTKQTNKEWLPKDIHHSVKTFIESVDKDLKTNENTHPKFSNNLSKGEIQSLHNLENRDDIIITRADKGNAVVIINVEDYLNEAKRQLDDINFYTKLDVDLTETHKDIVNTTIRNFVKEKLLPEHVGNALLLDDPKTARFYLLPKIHKPNNPGRPITNAINSPTSSIAEFVEFHLQPLVKKLKSYIQDTTDFLNKLDKIDNLPDEALLVTMDVKSLYTNIPHREGVNAVAQSLENNDGNSFSTRVILKFLNLILNLNNFTFNDDNILQIKGCSMGSKCSCSYANIFMGKFESDYIYPTINDKSLCYFRFVDDIFMIWIGTKEDLLIFFEQLNSKHDSIKFDCKYSTKEIDFLDTTVSITPSNTLSTRIFRKETDRNAYLHFKSYHPKRQKENIPYGQFLRAKKICSNAQHAEITMTEMKSKFLDRGYPVSNIDEQLVKAMSIDRGTLLTEKDPTTRGRRIPFTTTFNKNLPDINSTINKHWHLLQTNTKVAESFNEKPMVAFRRNKNLRELIGQTHLSGNKKILPLNKKKTGSSRACLNHGNNQCCKHMTSTKTFQSHITKENFKIKHHLNCRSRNVVYLGYCILCKRSQYVGKSEPPFNLRINTHRYDVKSPNGGPFDKHFNLPGHNYNDHARYILIEQIQSTKTKSKAEIRKLLENREDFWMTKLKTIIPNGCNDHLNSNTNNNIRIICS
jgi:hypothetical protein